MVNWLHYTLNEFGNSRNTVKKKMHMQKYDNFLNNNYKFYKFDTLPGNHSKKNVHNSEHDNFAKNHGKYNQSDPSSLESW